MVAASSGHVDIVRYLLEEGAPWNAVDRKYMCAGDYAARHGQQTCIDVLLDHAVMSELLLSLTSPKENADGDVNEHTVFTNHNPGKNSEPSAMNASYLASRLEFTPDGQRLIDKSTELAVMMDWEQPLMAKHAAWICYADRSNKPGSLRVLNVGFGMGIVDTEIQKHAPTSHVIIEAHPDVSFPRSFCDEKPINIPIRWLGFPNCRFYLFKRPYVARKNLQRVGFRVTSLQKLLK